MRIVPYVGTKPNQFRAAAKKNNGRWTKGAGSIHLNIWNQFKLFDLNSIDGAKKRRCCINFLARIQPVKCLALLRCGTQAICMRRLTGQIQCKLTNWVGCVSVFYCFAYDLNKVRTMHRMNIFRSVAMNRHQEATNHCI